MSNEFIIKGYQEKFKDYKKYSQGIIGHLEGTVKNKNLSIECLKNIIKKKELKISGYQMEITSLNRDIDRIKSRPFWRFWE